MNKLTNYSILALFFAFSMTQTLEGAKKITLKIDNGVPTSYNNYYIHPTVANLGDTIEYYNNLNIDIYSVTDGSDYNAPSSSLSMTGYLTSIYDYPQFTIRKGQKQSIIVNDKDIFPFSYYYFTYFSSFYTPALSYYNEVRIDRSTTQLNAVNQAPIVYPNPAKAYVSINTTGNVKLMDLSGKLVLNSYLKDVSTKIDISHLSAGIYLLSVEGGRPTKITIVK